MKYITNNIKGNIFKIYLNAFLFESMFFIAIMVPFLGSLGFTMQQIFIIESAFAATVVLLEIPSGYFADIYGRKKSVVIGALFELMGLILFVFSQNFIGFLVGEIIIGIGCSFQSGAIEALLYESLMQMGKENEYKRIQGNVFMIARVGAVISQITGAFLAAVFFRLPLYATVVPWFVALLSSFTLVEPKIKEEKFENWDHFIRIFKETFLENPKLRYFILYAAIPSGFFIITFWLYQRYMQFIELPIAYFGIVVASLGIFSGLGSKYAEKIEKIITPKLSLIIIPIIPTFVWLALSEIKSLFAIVLFIFPVFLWGFILPITNDFIQKMVTSDRRATILSVRSFLTRIIFLIFAPFLGWITDIYSVQTAFAVTAGLIFLLGGSSLLLLRKVKVI